MQKKIKIYIIKNEWLGSNKFFANKVPSSNKQYHMEKEKNNYFPS